MHNLNSTTFDESAIPGIMTVCVVLLFTSHISTYREECG